MFFLKKKMYIYFALFQAILVETYKCRKRVFYLGVTCIKGIVL